MEKQDAKLAWVDVLSPELLATDFYDQGFDENFEGNSKGTRLSKPSPQAAFRFPE